MLSGFKPGHFESLAAGVTGVCGLLFPGWYFHVCDDATGES